MKIELRVAGYRSSSPECFRQIIAAVSTCNRAGMRVDFDIYGSSILHWARNKVLAKVAADTDYLVMIDDDMLVDGSADSITRLLKNDAPVISALCTTRTKPVQLAVKLWSDKTKEFHQMDQLSLTRPSTGQFGIGAAFLALRRDVVSQLIEYHLTARDWLEDNRKVFDRMHVRAEQREKERAGIEVKRRVLWDTHQQVRVFDYITLDNQRETGEDIGLSMRLQQLGIPVTIDPRIAIGHVGEYPYGIGDYEPEITMQNLPKNTDGMEHLIGRTGGSDVSKLIGLVNQIGGVQ